MERADRAALATFHAPALRSAAGRLTLGEESAHHARVRRLGAGEEVRLTDGAGMLARGRIERVAKNALEIALDGGSRVEVSRPSAIHLLVPIGDRDRMLWLAEKSTELGVTSWHPVSWARSRSVSPRGEGGAFQERVARRMVAALEQSAGGWLPELGEELSPEGAAAAFPDALRLQLDPDGAPMPSLLGGGAPLAIALGPEGGLGSEEIALLRDAGWRAAALAPSVLRFETAAIAAVAVARAALLPASGTMGDSTQGR